MGSFDIGGSPEQFQNYQHATPQVPARTEVASAAPAPPTAEVLVEAKSVAPQRLNTRDVTRRFAGAQTTAADVDHALQNLVSKFVTTPLPVNSQGRLTKEDMEAFMKAALAELEHNLPEASQTAKLQSTPELRSSQVVAPMGAGRQGSPNLLADLARFSNNNPII